MTTQSATVTQRMKETELVNRSSEEIVDQCSRMIDVIARRAFEIFKSRGGSPGHDLEDWIRAEAELLHPVPLNVSESSGEYIVLAEVPGFASKDIEINVEPSCLSISGKRETMKEEVSAKMIRSEWCADQIVRTFGLPSDIDTSKVSTTLKDGILTVDLPKAQIAK
jgi:HSP20 family molecular chaperone IbpA